ncbi:N-acetylglucosamine-6-phosphate deacetylase [Kineosporia sp. R_H_3]|uniref:N-acetylglucosamine-6-phosphate deacetylase n=1 Tax=Kineosporia sp. R_H_3 TaxID=1961848 RepID=UPI000B4B2467|nr:N-acetylglucosamine-6-phosphate deacetylase [Kineosporia sp. R_H_3]
MTPPVLPTAGHVRQAGPPLVPLLLAGGDVLDVGTATFARGDVLLVGGRVAALGDVPADDVPAGTHRVDCTGLLVTPGLVDAQVNGAAGADLTREPERLVDVARALPAYGVTAFVPTVVTAAAGTVERALAAAAALATDGTAPAGSPVRASVVGVHAEGPFLSPARRGAHPPAHLRAPDRAFVAGWSRAGGLVTATLAPELPGALDVVADLTARGVVVWVGHTQATYEQVLAAVAAGARAVTHLFNAMPPLGHRDPGPVGAVLGDDDLVAGVIVDDLHVHPAVVRATWKALGRSRFMLVSDTTAALGLPDGRTVLGDHEVVLERGAVRLASDGVTLAGSGVGLDHCVRTLVAATGCPPAEAFVAATRTPADLLRRPDLGRLAVGGPADVVVWTPDLHPRTVVVGGRTAAPGPA